MVSSNASKNSIQPSSTHAIFQKACLLEKVGQTLCSPILHSCSSIGENLIRQPSIKRATIKDGKIQSLVNKIK